MKIFNKASIVFAGILAIGTVSSCKKLLVEEPRAALYPSYFSTPGGIVAAIGGVYSDQRGRGGEGTLFWVGTDEGRQGSGGNSTALQFDNYNGLNSSNAPDFGGQWSNINTLNGVIKFAN